MTARLLINVPPQVTAGQVFEIKTLIAHPMESGYRVGANGNLIPRDIIRRFVCAFEGEEVFSVDFSPAVAANPFLSFFLRAERSGSLTFDWSGDNGFSAGQTVALKVV